MQLKNRLKNIKLDDREILVSFDVVSLFTNIPVHTAIRNIMQKWNTIKNFTNIPYNKFLDILQFCLKDNNYFIYDKQIYHQIFGMPMGNPLSPTIADIVLDSLLDDAINELKNKNINIKYITKYVDDILAIIHVNDKDEILKTLNNHHPKIKFTIETEENNEIAYLDTKLRRVKDEISFDWYSKETASGRLMNFNSTQPKRQIINTATNFIERVLSISDTEFHNKNIKIINQTLIENSFPKTLINSLINTAIEKRRKNNHQINNTNSKEDTKFYSVQYIPGLTDNRIMKTTIKQNNISFAYKPNQTLSAIFTNVKTPIDRQQQNNVVYEIACKGKADESCNMIYIGTTKRALNTRVNEHKQDVAKGRESTALSQHIVETGHTADFTKVKILEKENNERKRFTKESLHIQQQIYKTLNFKEDTDNINGCYRVAIT